MYSEFKIFAVLYTIKEFQKMFKKESIEGRIKLQKFLFLLSEEYGFKLFKYEPYHYGVMSFELRDLLDELTHLYGYILKEYDDYTYYYSITKSGEEYLKSIIKATDKNTTLKLKREEIEKAILDILQKFGQMEDLKLIKYIYENYPAYRPEVVKL